MEQLDPAGLLRFLQKENDTLQQFQSKISNELHQLQVEEEVFVRALDRLNEKGNSTSSKDGRGGQGTMGADRMQAGRELLQALQSELSAVPVTPLQMVGPEPLQAIPEPTLQLELQSSGGPARGCRMHFLRMWNLKTRKTRMSCFKDSSLASHNLFQQG